MRPGRWWAEAVVAAAGLAVSGLHAALGPGYVLDDWFTLDNAHFRGAWAAAGPDQQAARPGAAVVYAFVFGVLGRWPLAVLAVQAALAVATAVALVVVLRRFLGAGWAVVATAGWVLLPNHTSLEVWASATNIALCVALAAGAAVVLSRPAGLDGGRRVLAVALLVAAGLCYEAVLPLAGALLVVLPWLARGRPDVPVVLGGAAGLGAVGGWILTHWHPAKAVQPEWADLGQAVGAHLGWGIAPQGLAGLVTVAGLAGILVAGTRLLLSSARASAGAGEWTVVAGVAVVGLGTVPFARYPYAPLGAGDRYDFVSAVGGALAWTGLLILLARVWRSVAVGAAVVLAAGGAVVRVERSVLWHRAGRDAVVIQEAAVARWPRPPALVVLGPAPVQQQNIAAYLDQSNVLGAFRLAWDDPGARVGIAQSRAQFEEYPPDQRLDIGPLSSLVDDRGPP